MNAQAEYLWSQIQNHIKRFFSLKALEIVNQTKIRFVDYKEAVTLREKVIAIPVDINASVIPHGIYKVDFNGTHINLWNRLPSIYQEGWSSIPNEHDPIWYQHESGTVIPAWNLFGNLFNLLTFQEEIIQTQRDQHGRFIASMSPRFQTGLLETPAFNDGVAIIVAACKGLARCGDPDYDLEDLVGQPVIILSHDNDILAGNDFWTQAVRLYRLFQPLLKGKKPNFKNLHWIIQNYHFPRQYYYEDIFKMIKCERDNGFRSCFYFLNGKYGRFGARSGLSIIKETIKAIPENWDMGIHYNYNTLLDEEKFYKQIKELQSIVDKDVVCGRAHYLRFDPQKSLHFLNKQGIKCDESAGYPDAIGYRCGIAGPFHPFDFQGKKALSILELPLNIMDATIIEQYGADPIKVFERLLTHLSRVGGAITILWHPGMAFNPEFPETYGIYPKILETAKTLNVSSATSYMEALNG